MTAGVHRGVCAAGAYAGGATPCSPEQDTRVRRLAILMLGDENQAATTINLATLRNELAAG